MEDKPLDGGYIQLITFLLWILNFFVCWSHFVSFFCEKCVMYIINNILDFPFQLIAGLLILAKPFLFRGVPPFPQRKRLWEKYRAKCRKQRQSTNQPDIVAGSQVCMKNSPMYHPGAIAFTVAVGMPKVGNLQNSAWTLSDTCTFKVVNPAANSGGGEKIKEGLTAGISGLSKY